MGNDVSGVERVLVLPAHWGGLGVFNPTELTAMSSMSFAMFRCAIDIIVRQLNGKSRFELDVHINQLIDIQTDASRVKEHLYSYKFKGILGQFDSTHQGAILRLRNEKTCGWLTVLPLAKVSLIYHLMNFGLC